MFQLLGVCLLVTMLHFMLPHTHLLKSAGHAIIIDFAFQHLIYSVHVLRFIALTLGTEYLGLNKVQ